MGRAKKARLRGLFFDKAQEQGEDNAGSDDAPGGQAGDVYDGMAFGLVAILHEYGRWPLPNKAAVRKVDNECL